MNLPQTETQSLGVRTPKWTVLCVAFVFTAAKNIAAQSADIRASVLSVQSGNLTYLQGQK